MGGKVVERSQNHLGFRGFAITVKNFQYRNSSLKTGDFSRVLTKCINKWR